MTRAREAQRRFGNQAVLRAGSVLQRACACDGSTTTPCETCAQRQADGARGAAIPPRVGEVLARPGRPLDPATRAPLEAAFAHDLGDVRIHTDAEAARSAHELHARAYTVGRQIVFGAGRYQPTTDAGRRLLAHELVHTIQQRGLQARADAPLDTTPTGLALEREADVAAGAAVEGRPVPALGRGASALQRQQEPEVAPLERTTCDTDRSRLDQRTVPHALIEEDFRLRLDRRAKPEYAIPNAGDVEGEIGYADLVVPGEFVDVYEVKSERNIQNGRRDVERYLRHGMSCIRSRWRPGSAYPHTRDDPKRFPVPGEDDREMLAWRESGGVIAYRFDESDEERRCEESQRQLRQRTLPHALIEDDFKYNLGWSPALREYAIPGSGESGTATGHADVVDFSEGGAQVYDVKSFDEGGRPAAERQLDRYVDAGPRECGRGRWEKGVRYGDFYPVWRRRPLAWPGEPRAVLWVWQESDYPGILFYEVDHDPSEQPRWRYETRVGRDIARAYAEAELQRWIDETVTRVARVVAHVLINAIISRILRGLLASRGSAGGSTSTGTSQTTGGAGTQTTGGQGESTRIRVVAEGEGEGAGTGTTATPTTGASASTSTAGGSRQFGPGDQVRAETGGGSGGTGGAGAAGGPEGADAAAEEVTRGTIAAVAAVARAVIGSGGRGDGGGRSATADPSGTRPSSGGPGGAGTGVGRDETGRSSRSTEGNAILPDDPRVDAFLAAHPEVMARAQELHDRLSSSPLRLTVAELDALLIPVTSVEDEGAVGAPRGATPAAASGTTAGDRPRRADRTMTASDLAELDQDLDFEHIDDVAPSSAADRARGRGPLRTGPDLESGPLIMRTARRRVVPVAALPPGTTASTGVQIVQWAEHGVPRHRFTVTVYAPDEASGITFIVRVPVDPDAGRSVVTRGVVQTFQGHVVGNWRIDGTDLVLTDGTPVSWDRASAPGNAPGEG